MHSCYVERVAAAAPTAAADKFVNRERSVFK